MRWEERLWGERLERKKARKSHDVQCDKVSKDKHLIIASRATDTSESMRIMCRLEP